MKPNVASGCGVLLPALCGPASPAGIYSEAVGEWEDREDQSLSSGGGGLLETLRDPLFPPSPYEQAPLASLVLSAAPSVSGHPGSRVGAAIIIFYLNHTPPCTDTCFHSASKTQLPISQT